MFVPDKYQILQILEQIEPFVYEWTSKHHGSISAEHGLGHVKADKIHYSKSPETVSLIDCIIGTCTNILLFSDNLHCLV